MVVGFNFVVCILALIMLGSFLFRSKKVDSLFIMFEREVERQTEHIVHIKDMMVLGMADMVESRDTYTGGHIK